MKFGVLNDHAFALRLEPGDDVHTSIQDFCAAHSIANAGIIGIGSLESPTLAHYSIKTKHFTHSPFIGIYEVTSLIGNVALQDNQHFAHLHATIAGPDFQSLGGHLVKGQCSATLELILESYPTNFSKTPNDAIGLSLWDFEA
jgi:uncharacterized protein